jgi:hypothetical protein
LRWCKRLCNCRGGGKGDVRDWLLGGLRGVRYARGVTDWRCVICQKQKELAERVIKRDVLGARGLRGVRC